MSFEVWWAFFIGSALVCSSPGPNMLHILSYSANHGFKKAIYTMAGCLTAISLIIVASVLGVGALLIASPDAFNILRYLGAAYLIYVGCRSCLNNASIIDPEVIDKDNIAITKLDGFKKGFFVGISNPKACLFAIAFFPQFINSDMPQLPQFLILFVTFIFIECSCYVAYALGGKSLSTFLAKAACQRIFNIIIGILFICFGILCCSTSCTKLLLPYCL